ncbi:MAG TPA: RDD family protein [Myxococcaceae bacterium]|nr:RDD family protein [Myxococcaceae bacterium]
MVPAVSPTPRVSPAYPPVISAPPPLPPAPRAPAASAQPPNQSTRTLGTSIRATPPQFASIARPSVTPSLQTPTSPGSARTSPTIVEVQAQVAPVWRRLVAFFVDGIAISAIGALYLWAAFSIAGASGSPLRLSGIDRWVERIAAIQWAIISGLVLATLIALAYSAAFAVLWNGRTLGRLLAGVRLVDRSGLPPSPTRAVVRALLSAVSFALFLGGFWLALFDRRGQTLHDKLTSTFVVRAL